MLRVDQPVTDKSLLLNTKMVHMLSLQLLEVKKVVIVSASMVVQEVMVVTVEVVEVPARAISRARLAVEVGFYHLMERMVMALMVEMVMVEVAPEALAAVSILELEVAVEVAVEVLAVL